MKQTFRQWLNEKEGVETEYQKFFKKKCEEYNVKSPSELSAEDKKKFFSEIEKEWTGDKEEINESDKSMTVSLYEKGKFKYSLGSGEWKKTRDGIGFFQNNNLEIELSKSAIEALEDFIKLK